MKLNGRKVTGFDYTMNTFILEGGTTLYISGVTDLDLEGDTSTPVIELAKLGYSADDIVKLKQQGVL